ncbi:MAG: M48 family metalloprotease [Planctomycetes bacterium]|nr:M48 family metalloprotease [Planctomycetota bacterium]
MSRSATNQGGNSLAPPRVLTTPWWRGAMVGAVALAVSLFASTACRAGDAADQVLIDQVYQRLLAVVDPVAGMPWPPKVRIDEKDETNAYAHMRGDDDKESPEIVIHRTLLKQVVQGKPGRLAYLLGHELSHVLCGHVQRTLRNKTEFVRVAASREQELEADLRGVEIAIKAGYPRDELIDCLHAFIALKDVTSFEGLQSDHPSWHDRLAHLDRNHARLARASAAFHTGNRLLMLEQYDSAVHCFRSATHEFPKCQEAWCNLGYAHLLQYCDLLTAENLKTMNVGQLVLTGFYRQSTLLDGEFEKDGVKPGSTSGPNEDIWNDAVKALSEALRLDPQSVVANANMGAAYMLAPDGKDYVKAGEYFGRALAGKSRHDDSDKTAASLLEVALLTNSSVSDFSNGRSDDAAKKLEQAEQRLAKAAGSSSDAHVNSALLYNRALVMSAAKDVATRKQAVKLWENYLHRSSPSPWWEMAHAKYLQLCTDMKVKAKEREQLLAGRERSLRMVTSVTVPGVGPITLTDSWQAVQETLGNTTLKPEVPRTSIQRAIYSEYGVELIIDDDEVLAIVLPTKQSPPLVVRESGTDADTMKLNVGMSRDELEQVLTQIPEYGHFIDPEANYRLYRNLGLAVRVQQGRVTELIVARIPEVPVH